MQQLHLSGSHPILIQSHLRCWRSSQRSTTLETLAAWRRPASRSSLRRSKGEMLALKWPMRLPARLPEYKRSSDSFFLFRLKSWECSLPSQPTSQSRPTESILGTVQVTQNVKKWQRFISPFFVYKTTENFRSCGLCNVHGKDRRSCHREHFHRNGEAYQLPSRTKIYYSKIKQYLHCIDIPNQIYWDDGEVTDENDTETNSFWFTHTYADVSTNMLYYNLFSNFSAWQVQYQRDCVQPPQ